MRYLDGRFRLGSHTALIQLDDGTLIATCCDAEFRKELEAIVAELKKEDMEAHAIDDLKKQGIF